MTIPMFLLPCPLCNTYLLLREFALDLQVVTVLVHQGAAQLMLHIRQPAAQLAHVVLQLLHRLQGVLQLLQPATHTYTWVWKYQP